MTALRVLVALGPGDLDRGYVLRPDGEGGWTCACFQARWRGDCAHVQTAKARGEGDRLMLVETAPISTEPAPE